MTIDALLDEAGGVGACPAGGAALLPIVLGPSAGNEPADAIYEEPRLRGEPRVTRDCRWPAPPQQLGQGKPCRPQVDSCFIAP